MNFTIARGLLGVWIWGAFFSVSSPAMADPFLDSALKDGVGVRAEGMGGAFTGASTDANAVFYNPAGMAEQGFQYERGYMDAQREHFLSADYTLVSLPSLGFGDLNFQDTKGNLIQVFSTAFGVRGDNRVAWGFTHKTVNGVLGGVPISGYSMDAGLHGLIQPNWAYGVLLQDIFRQNVPVSTTVRLGTAYRHTGSKGLFTADLEIRDLKAASGAKLFPHYGLESVLTNHLKVRLGWGRDLYTAGVTAEFKWMTFTYALTTSATQNTVHQMAFQFFR